MKQNLFVKVLIYTAVIGIIILLMMINTKLLIHLNWIKTSNFFLDTVLVTIAGLAFALGSISVVIFYNPEPSESTSKVSFVFKKLSSILLKVTFALLDGFHVYVYNNSHIEDIATWVSPIFAIQTALILFFIGNTVHKISNTNTLLLQETKQEKNQVESNSNLLSEIEIGYYKNEKRRILQKKEENRTEEEKSLLQKAISYFGE